MLDLYASALWRTAAVMRQWRDIFDRFDGEASRLQGSNRAFAATAGTFDLHFHFFHAKFRRLFGGLLGGHLAGKWRALPRAFESTGTGARRAKRISLAIGDRHRRVVERRADIRDPQGYVATSLAFFNLSHANSKNSVR